LKRIEIEDVTAVASYVSRLRGLMGRRDLSCVRFWFPRCSSVHTCFMLGPIDIVFLDRDRIAVAVYFEAKSWRFFYGGRKADSVIELSAGFARRHGLEIGDQIVWLG
jgi:uncharacterized membrane protein (UPF0127 family)